MVRRKVAFIPIDLPALSAPRVSVIVCNYNYARFLDSALTSAVEQSYPCEVVVVDDGSTDESRDVLASWSERVRIVLQENAGQAAAYNSGFYASTGDVVIFLDSDDTLNEHAARRVAEAFAEGVAKVHFRLRLVDASGRPLGGEIPRVLASGDVSINLVKHGVLYPSSPGSGNAYRRPVLERLFPLPVDPLDRHGADFFTVYGSGLYGEVRIAPGVLGSYRVHETSGRDAAATSLVFGNAARGSDEVRLFHQRARQFRYWIARRTDDRVVLPLRLVDFSMEKVTFARAVFEAGGYIAGLRRGISELGPLLWSLWLRAEYSVIRKLGLTGWSLVVLVAPRRLGFRLARFVCNPASRI